MTTIVKLARCRYGAAKDQETDAETWTRELARFPEAVRHRAANLAAHSHDITLVGDRLLISCAWYNSVKWPDTGWYSLDGTWTPITADEWDAIHPEVDRGGSNQSGKQRSYTVNDDFLKNSC